MVNELSFFSKLQSNAGLWRSIAIYYGIPFRKRRLTNFYAQFVDEGDLCFDIGAHVGNRVAAWLALGARVVAVEPQPSCMGLLQCWYGSNERVTLVDGAVGARAGVEQMYVCRNNPTVTTMSRQWIDEVTRVDGFASVRWQDEVPVNVTTLDVLIARYGVPRFCKIDVEGYELAVLQGLSQPLRTISFEFVPASQQVSVGCVERLAGLGDYEFNWSKGESHRLVFDSWLSAEEVVGLLSSMAPDDDSGDVYARLRA